MRRAHRRLAAARGISLLEMLVVVAIVGILSFVASGHYAKVFEHSRETVARNLIELLNQGVSRYSQLEGSGLRKVAADDTGSQDEVAVLRALQWIDPVQPTPGGPYMRQDYDPPLSGSADDFRAVWNGAFFELRAPGEPGAGLAIMFDGSDMGKTVSFAGDFQPLAGY